MRVYTAGPMTGLPDYNFPAFHEAARRIRAEGHEVHNPAESFDGATDLPRETYMRFDIGLILDSDAVAVLPRWQRSKGARLEVAVAVAIGIPVLWASDLSPVPDILLRPVCRCSP